jgi:hypothetical protein
VGTEGARSTTPARAARAVVVVCLLGIAALSLSGRRGLEWDELTRVPDVAWVRVVLGGLAALLVLVAVRRLIQLWRKLRPRRPEPPTQTEGRPVPWLGWLFAATAVAVTVVTCYLVIRLVLNRVPDAGFTGAASHSGPGAVGSPEGLLPVLMGMVVLLALAATVAFRYRAGAVTATTEEPDDASDAELLAGAVVAAERAMERFDDTRATIIAAYLEMTARLRPAPGHRASDTPTELLDRAVSAGLVSRGAALELTELFREARFSRHQLDPAKRDAAEFALARVSAELAMTDA